MDGNGAAIGVEIISRYIGPDETPIADHIEILRYWNEKRGKRFAPRWDEISLSQLPPKALPLISVTDLEQKPVKSTYRF